MDCSIKDLLDFPLFIIVSKNVYDSECYKKNNRKQHQNQLFVLWLFLWFSDPFFSPCFICSKLCNQYIDSEHVHLSFDKASFTFVKSGCLLCWYFSSGDIVVAFFFFFYSFGVLPLFSRSTSTNECTFCPCFFMGEEWGGRKE